MIRRAVACPLIAIILAVTTIPGCSGCNEGGGDTDLLSILALLGTKKWTHPAGLADNISPDGQDIESPLVAMDNNGNAIIVWRQSDGTDDQIFKSEYRSGSWTHPTDIDDHISFGGYDSGGVHVAMDNNGNAIIAWIQSDGTNDRVFKSEYRSGSWTHPTDKDDNIDPGGQDASSPQVAMDDNGNAIIAWRQSDGSNLQIFKSEYRPPDPWTVSADISIGGQHAYAPVVAMDNNGNAIIAWYQSDGSHSQIFKSEYRPPDPWTNPAGLADNISPDGYPANDPSVAMDNNGNAIIAWYQSDGSFDRVFMSEYRSDLWTHPADKSYFVSPSDGENAYFPTVAMDDNGSAIITWQQYDGTTTYCFKSEYRLGAWTHPSDMSDHISPDGDWVIRPKVAMNNRGNAIIVWRQSDGSNDQIFKSEYRSGSWIHPAAFADNISPDGQDAVNPALAMDDNGNAIIVWRQSDGSNDQVFMSEYR